MFNPRIYCSFVVILFAAPLIGCGQKASPSLESLALNVFCGNTQMQGIWNSLDDQSRADILTINRGCHGTSTYCDSEFYYDSEFGSDQFVMHVVKTNGNPTCPTVGDHACIFTVNLSSNLPAGSLPGATSNVNCPTIRTYVRVGSAP